jgi:hypothetical protein
MRRLIAAKHDGNPAHSFAADQADFYARASLGWTATTEAIPASGKYTASIRRFWSL